MVLNKTIKLTSCAKTTRALWYAGKMEQGKTSYYPQKVFEIFFK